MTGNDGGTSQRDESKLALYADILALRDVADATRRGFAFEVAVRDVLPWDHRPPFSVRTKSAQFDAFFEWLGRIFWVEAKAKKTPIRRASHDWEDFALKVREGRQTCVGLFCSLYPVNSDIGSAAAQMNTEGFTVLVVAGEAWDALAADSLPFGDVLRYMIMQARISGAAMAPAPTIVRKWTYNRQAATTKVERACRELSAAFLRRHKHPKHKEIYVQRALDVAVTSMAMDLRPSRLEAVQRRFRKKSAHPEWTGRRESPTQICTLRDDSGSGKTTLSVQLGLTTSPFFGVALEALHPDLDRALEAAVRSLGQDCGIEELRASNRPLLVAIDSLDEARHVPEKRRQVLAAVRLLDELNSLAESRGLLAYPLGLIFTVREDYWEPWASLFEKRKVLTLRRRCSRFNGTEMPIALEKYACAYDYTPAGPPTEAALAVLSIPFNLDVFSAANDSMGTVSLADVLETNVLSLYFARKEEDILRRQLRDLTGERLMWLASQFAVACVDRGENALPRNLLLEIVEALPCFKGSGEQVLVAMTSEQLLSRDGGGLHFRFRHTQFLEYLLAYHIVTSIGEGGGLTELEAIVASLASSGVASAFRVHDVVRHLCDRRYPEVKELIENYYAQCEQYVVANLQRLRSHLANNDQTPQRDLTMVLQALGPASADSALDAFFVIAAQNNRQPPARILESFCIAWEKSQGHPDRWRLVGKLADRNLLASDDVLVRLFETGTQKEWEVYLGAALETDQTGEIRELWEQASGDTLVAGLRARMRSPGWEQVQYLLTTFRSGDPFVIGSTSL